MKERAKMNSKGFTLIEVIITIVIAAILGVFLVSYMSGGITKSSIPVIWVKNQFNIYETMEKITADYRKAVSSPSFNLNTFASTIKSTYETGGITLTHDDYIAIDRTATNPTASPSNSTDGLILKVKLQSGDQSVTSLFTR